MECSPSSVARWREVVRKSGMEGLAAKRHPGPRPRLSEKQKEKLVKLLLKGPQDPVSSDVSDFLTRDGRVHLLSWAPKDDMPAYYALMHIVVLPTYREGFPNVPLEAAAMGLPVVATRIPGCVDAVVDGVTGILVSPRDSVALADAIRRLLKNPELRQRMGKAGRERVLRDFRPEPIWEALYKEYMSVLSRKSSVLPQHRDRGPDAA